MPRFEDSIDVDVAEVHQPAHWLYLAGVMSGGAVLMLVFMTWLGAAAG